MASQTARLIPLGTAAIAVPAHDTVYLLLDTGHTKVLIDCGGSPSARVMRAGVSLIDLDGLIVTHHHPDHIYGVPVLLVNLWLLGRRGAFPIYGPGKALNIIRHMLDLYEWHTWQDFLQVEFHEVPLVADTFVVADQLVSIVASPVAHVVPTIGLRMTNQETGKVLVYTSDTTPGPEVVRLARNADILIHEATGDYHGHSSGADAARDAARDARGKPTPNGWCSSTILLCAGIQRRYWSRQKPSFRDQWSWPRILGCMNSLWFYPSLTGLHVAWRYAKSPRGGINSVTSTTSKVWSPIRTRSPGFGSRSMFWIPPTSRRPGTTKLTL